MCERRGTTGGGDVFVTDDVHGTLEYGRIACNLAKIAQNERQGGDERTPLLVAGDFGLLWKREPDSAEMSALDQLEALARDTLFIDGNPENFDKLDALHTKFRWGANVGMVRKNIFHLRSGRICEIAGRSVWCFGGAFSIDRKYRRLGESWWEWEIPSQEEMKLGEKALEAREWRVDLVLTHTAPKSVYAFLCGERFKDPVAEWLEEIAKKMQTRLWIFGHLHNDDGEYLPREPFQEIFPGVDRFLSVCRNVR